MLVLKVAIEFHQHGTKNEPGMQKDGLDVTVMGGHNVEALPKRVLVVLSSIATFLEIGYDGIGVDKRQTSMLSLFHHTNAPINISRMAIFQVVRELAGNVKTGIESLMADKHAFFERTPSEQLGWTMATQMEETPLTVGDGCVTIDYGREVLRADG